MISTPTDSNDLGDYLPTADERVVLHDVGWTGFQSMLALRGERRRPRVAYLDGAVELMSPSHGHERIKSRLGSLLEHYCVEHGIPVGPYGEWLLHDASEDAGAEPDECYVFGRDPDAKPKPDLVIEVAWSRGGLSKLEIYRRLRIAEVWIWKRDAITVYVLDGDEYVQRPCSTWVPDLAVGALCEAAAIGLLNDAVARLRELLKT